VADARRPLGDTPRTPRLGIKTAWRDVAAMATLAEKHGATVLEYQMLPGDIEYRKQEVFDAFLPYRGRFELRVHQPEAFEHGGKLHFLDPSSPDPAKRGDSAAFLAECARFAMELRAKALIFHPGGVWRDGEVGGSPGLLRESLSDMPKHVKLLLENMPHFYETRSLPGTPPGNSPAGFRTPSGLKHVDDLVDGYVLDISHAYLAVPRGSEAVVHAFVRELGARIVHVHANGSRGGVGCAGEGTPFSDSDYGADLVRSVLSGVSPDAVVVPEIKDGHHEGGRKFDEGLAFLRALSFW